MVSLDVLASRPGAWGDVVVLRVESIESSKDTVQQTTVNIQYHHCDEDDDNNNNDDDAIKCRQGWVPGVMCWCRGSSPSSPVKTMSNTLHTISPQ